MVKIKLMIVDDMESVRQSLSTILELTNDLEVIGEARDGLEAIQKLEVLKPDVVLMDLEMPMLDGLETTQRVKDIYQDIKVVMITIHDSTDNREKAAHVGVDAFIEKGAPTEILVETIHKVIEKSPK